MVISRLKVEILFSWLWVKRCVFAGNVGKFLNKYGAMLGVYPRLGSAYHNSCALSNRKMSHTSSLQ